MSPSGHAANAGHHGSANRDPARFADPDRFDIARRPNARLAFGAGRHVCLGAALARIEMRAMVREAARRLPGLRLDATQPFRRKVRIEEAHFTFRRLASRRASARHARSARMPAICAA